MPQSENTGMRCLLDDADGAVRLFDYAEDAEIDALRDLRAKRDAAEAEGRRLASRASQIETEAATSKAAAETAKAKHRAALVMAEIGGGAKPDPRPVAKAEIDAEDARVVANEIRREAKARTDEAGRLNGELRSSVADLAGKCMQRAAGDYLAAARQVAALHAVISAGHRLSGIKAVLGHEWEQVVIPNSSVLDALRDVGTVRGAPSHFRLPIFGGDTRVRESTDAASAAARDDMRDAIGEWPTERR